MYNPDGDVRSFFRICCLDSGMGINENGIRYAVYGAWKGKTLNRRPYTLNLLKESNTVILPLYSIRIDELKLIPIRLKYRYKGTLGNRNRSYHLHSLLSLFLFFKEFALT